jgi:SAM-dependent methyltransferase
VHATTSGGTGSYWSDMDTDWYWSIPPPLRPGPDDLDHYLAEIRRWRPAGSGHRVMVMGATPGLHDLSWPPGTKLVAVDKSAFMLERLWPGGPETTRCEDWTTMSLPDGSRDIALTDLGLCFVRNSRQAALASTLGRILAPGGLFIARHICAAGAARDFDRVMRDFLSGKLHNSSELKMRLALALAGERARVRLGDIWARYDDAIPDRSKLPVLTGWSERELSRIEGYRDAGELYYFPGLQELERSFTGAGFEMAAQQIPNSAMREHTYLLTFRKP